MTDKFKLIKHCNNYMENKKIIFFSLAVLSLILLVEITSAIPIYYNVSLNYNKGKIEIKNVDVIFSQGDIETNSGEYIWEILDENKAVQTGNFYIPNIVFYDYINESGEIYGGGSEVLDEIDFEIFIPYNEYGKRIFIYSSSRNELGRKDISIFAKDKTESKINSYENEQDKQDIEENTETENKNSLYLIAGVVVLVLIIIGVLTWILKKDKNT